jgi:hypothetical protein
MPAATSNPSVSPARRIDYHRPSLPFVAQGQNPFTNPRPLQSPQTYNNGLGQSGMYASPASDNRRTRGSIGYPSNGLGISSGIGGILPTPDPTVGSCMSEEDKDVAIQLMRLGEMSNISHGRTSASTLDDTFSGKADAASSTGATSDVDSDSENELPPPRRQRLDASGASKRIYQTTENHFMPPGGSAEVSHDDVDYEDGPEDGSAESKILALKAGQPSAKPRVGSSLVKNNKLAKIGKNSSRPSSNIKTKKMPSIPNGPMSPASAPHSRKPSIASSGNMAHGTNEDEQPDLSTKPRCQRCRKSKKGCDRQRPCARCRDAGLTADQCISEDEGNGRKGRFGRHMGVPIKKDDVAHLEQPSLLPAAPIATAASVLGDKNKKRKR